MALFIDIIGNPITLLIERLFYLLIGIFFLVAIVSAVKRGKDEESNNHKE